MKVMRNSIVIVAFWVGLFFFVLFLLSGGFGNKTTDISEYREFSNYRGESNLEIFPEKIYTSAEEVKYFYVYRNGVLDKESQIYLEYTLSRSEFRIEVKRLRNTATIVNTEDYLYPAYLIVNENKEIHEYALVDKENFRIYYIYLQYIPRGKVKFDEEYLNKEYNYENAFND